MNGNRIARYPALLGATILAACGGGEAPRAGETAAGSTASGVSATAGTPMGGMQGMSGGSAGSQMHAHMQMMERMEPDSMKAMLPMHRQMAANMLAQFNKEMRDMNMPADAAWNATVDSLRQDLRTMPEWGSTELRQRMPEHHARLMRLMQMHQAMMKNMGM